MLYDLADGPPPPGSLVESVFLVIAKRRQEAQFFQAKMIMEASLAAHVEKGGEILDKTYRAFKDSMFPFLAGSEKREAKKQKKLLDSWTKGGPMKVKPLWRPKDSSALISKLKRGAERTKQDEELRRRVPHKRI